MPRHVQEVIDRIQSTYAPVSIFLYGSRARGDASNESDYGLGVLYRSGKKIFRAELNELNRHPDVVIYPFEFESLLTGNISTPYPERIYLRDLLKSARTLVGEKVIEEMDQLPIRIIDTLETLVFHTGVALSAMQSFHQRDLDTVRSEFSKSALFGIRCLVIVQSKKFPLSYAEIRDEAQAIGMGEYSDVITRAFAVRQGADIDQAVLQMNLAMHSQFIKPKIAAAAAEQGYDFVLA